MYYLYIAVTHNNQSYSILILVFYNYIKTILDITLAFIFHNEIGFPRHGG